MFNHNRLSLARIRRKLTKKGLAEAIGVDQKTIIRYESGEITPPPESLSILARTLRFPENFFEGDDIDAPPVEAVSFRALTTLTIRDRDAALVAASFAFLLSDWMAKNFSLPKDELIDLKEDANPESAAYYLRQEWGLGIKPISNLIHLLESKGIRVFSLVENTRSVDAFSIWRKDVPYIFLNTTKTAERSRFDAAHELGHLILHKHGGPSGRKAEEQANQFASAFLMPEEDIKAKLPRVHSLNQLIEAKKVWRVSMAALNYRLHKLDITTEWQYRNFCIQINERFKSGEPYPLKREMSIVWEKIFNALRVEKTTKHNIAESLGLPVSEIEDLVFQLSNMQSIEGTSQITSCVKPKLRIIKQTEPYACSKKNQDTEYYFYKTYWNDIARAALNASSAVAELTALQERYDALMKDEWVNIKDKLPDKQEVNYLVLSETYGYNIGYYAPRFKGFEPIFDVPNVTHYKLITPPKKD